MWKACTEGRCKKAKLEGGPRTRLPPLTRARGASAATTAAASSSAARRLRATLRILLQRWQTARASESAGRAAEEAAAVCLTTSGRSPAPFKPPGADKNACKRRQNANKHVSQLSQPASFSS